MKWRSKDGEVTDIRDMQDNHLFYACRIVMNRLVEDNPGVATDLTKSEMFVAMRDELRRRDFDHPVSLNETWSQMVTRIEEARIARQLTPEQEKWIDDQFTF